MAVTGLDKVFVVNAETNTKYGGVDSTGEFVTINELVPQPYKVYTALLAQSGGDNPDSISGDGGTLDIGYTYVISSNPDNYDLTIYGAPNNDSGTYFTCTNSVLALPYTDSLDIGINYGAPVVTVLENTIGNVWWTWQGKGLFWANSDSLFTRDKTLAFISQSTASERDVPVTAYTYGFGRNSVEIETYGSINEKSDGVLNKTPIEIRVYN